MHFLFKRGKPNHNYCKIILPYHALCLFTQTSALSSGSKACLHLFSLLVFKDVFPFSIWWFILLSGLAKCWNCSAWFEKAESNKWGFNRVSSFRSGWFSCSFTEASWLAFVDSTSYFLFGNHDYQNWMLFWNSRRKHTILVRSIDFAVGHLGI